MREAIDIPAALPVEAGRQDEGAVFNPSCLPLRVPLHSRAGVPLPARAVCPITAQGQTGGF